MFFKKAAVLGLAVAGAYGAQIQKRDGAHGHAHAAAAPASGYGAPAPATGYGAPDTSYAAPDTGYGAPDAGYAAPDKLCIVARVCRKIICVSACPRCSC